MRKDLGMRLSKELLDVPLEITKNWKVIAVIHNDFDEDYFFEVRIKDQDLHNDTLSLNTQGISSVLT